jgi:uncharacterized membrane protein
MKPIDARRVEAAIHAAERRTSGELRVAFARFFLGRDVQRAAQRTFARLGMHRTKLRNAVLIFIAPVGRRCAIVADEGAHAVVAPTFWTSVVEKMVSQFRAGDLTGGVEAGIQEIGEQLAGPFPIQPGDVNELPDTVVR